VTFLFKANKRFTACDCHLTVDDSAFGHGNDASLHGGANASRFAYLELLCDHETASKLTGNESVFRTHVPFPPRAIGQRERAFHGRIAPHLSGNCEIAVTAHVSYKRAAEPNERGTRRHAIHQTAAWSVGHAAYLLT
jgi:hypothetical protein